MTERHSTLNDPIHGGPTPLTPGARRLLERLRDRGPIPRPGNAPRPLLTRLERLGYVQAGPGAGQIEITEKGRLALTPLE